MASIHDLKSSNFLTQKDVERPVLATISSWERVNVAKEGAEPEYRYALHFRELDKPMTLNITNGQIIAAFLGSEEFDDWVGHKIVIYRDPNIMYGGKMVGGIRVRAPKAGYQQPEPEPEPEDENIPF
jgi:hypothetical protein